MFLPILHSTQEGQVDQRRSLCFDAESGPELARLIDQERLIATALGGPLTGLPDPVALSSWRAVLDLACGPGGWVLDMAFAHPHLEVAGIDMSTSIVNYARARAYTQKLPNASFQVMDVAQPLDFADATFDLINARFLSRVLRRESWPPLLAECRRILKPGGIFQLTETEDESVIGSPAYHRLKTLMELLGYEQEQRESIPCLPDLFQEAGYHQVQTTRSVLDFSSGTDAWNPWVQNTLVLILQVLPIMSNFVAQEKLDLLYDQMIIELQSLSFRGMWKFKSYLYRR